MECIFLLFIFLISIIILLYFIFRDGKIPREKILDRWNNQNCPHDEFNEKRVFEIDGTVTRIICTKYNKIIK